VAHVFSVDGVVPVVHPTAFVHPEAVLTGDVRVGAGCYVGPFASLRGDMGTIEVRDGANVQDSCVLHCFPGKSTLVEENGHVGHGAVLHGCVVGHDALVGINAVLMDGVVVGARAFVGAHSFVSTGTTVRPGWLAVGSPARELRELTEDEKAWKANGTRVYQDLARRCLATLAPAEPLRELGEGDRLLSVSVDTARTLREHRSAQPDR
jgi:carbonic anhydrase/acetyltransferase-like protein (isoleucine patch superfamily)